jgi:hypothetical protein
MLLEPSTSFVKPFIPTLEQEDFLLRWFALDPKTGAFVNRTGLLQRPRGWGKSPFLAALCVFEGLGPCLFGGWDDAGQPFGVSRLDVGQIPLITVAAVSEEQTSNTWTPLMQMLRDDAPIHDYFHVDPGTSRILLEGGGRIAYSTSSASTIRGKPTHFAVCDQTESWTRGKGGVALHNTISANVAKVNGRMIESPNAFVPGKDSVAESSYSANVAMIEGRARVKSLLYDTRAAHADTDITDYDSLIAGLRFAYGCSSAHPDGCVLHDPPCDPGWVNLDAIVDKFWDPRSDVQLCRADYLNQVTHASDSWISQVDWAARFGEGVFLTEGDMICLGFDGSRGRSRGKADATALVGVRVSDGFVVELGVWEQPEGLAGKGWVPPVGEIDLCVEAAHRRFRVVGFSADPTGWETYVAKWEARWGKSYKVRAGASPIAAWPRGKDSRVTVHVEQFRSAVENGEMLHDGGVSLTRHVLNARRRPTRNGYLIYKEFPDSVKKIDAAYAAVMAWKSRTEVLGRMRGSYLAW